MSKRLVPVVLLLATAALTGCGGNDSNSATDATGSPTTSAPTSPGGAAAGNTCDYTQDGSESGKQVDPPPSTPSVTGMVPATMATSVGDFKLTLNADTTPCTVNSFVSLAKQGYFDGTSCHRMTTEGIHVLQCGDPTATGSGGPGYSFPDELSGNESYPAGTLAMANAGPDTNGSQFFIVYGETPLPPQYTVFGNVDDATVAAIKKVAAHGTDNANGQGDGAPKTPVDITSVTVG
jgi:peptidyl-prolyl cis-trans isomerase B (cyclophilin B)